MNIYNTLLLALAFFTATAVTGTDEAPIGLPGRALEPSELKALENFVFAEGKGLPSGSGNVQTGAPIYRDHCAGCHGSSGEGASAVELVGDRTLLNTEYPDKGIGVYWPYAPTLYQYIQRAMPPEKPHQFTADELYSLVAYVLYLNQLLPADAFLDATTLGSIEMPNRDGFTDRL